MAQRYEDETADNFPNDFNKKDIDSRVELRATAVRNKIYGDDVREAVAQAVEISSAVSTEAKKTADDSNALSEDTQAQFKAVQQGATSDTEVKTARHSKADGKTYDVLNDRLDAMDKKPQQAVNNLQIGGRNLLLDTDFYLTSPNAAHNNMNLSVNIQELAGKTVTFSLDVDVKNVKTIKDGNSYTRALFQIKLARTDGSFDYIGVMWENFAVGDSYSGRITRTTTVPNNDYKDTTDIALGVYTQGFTADSIKVGHPKLEFGNKATDWTPAPKDSHHHQAFRKGTRFFAHRGNIKQAPENSLPAIKRTTGFTGVEIDIHATSDGRWVVMHDGTVDRMTNGTGMIASFTFNDLRKLRIDVGNEFFEHWRDSDLLIPTLEEALTVCKERQLIPVVEIKKDAGEVYTSDNFDSLTNIIKQFGVEDEMMFISFDYNSLKEVKKRMPLVEVQYLTRGLTADLISQAQQLGVNSGLDVEYSAKNLTNGNVLKAHQAGLKVGVWCPNNDSTRNSLLSKGVDFITTNANSGELMWQYFNRDNIWNGWYNIQDPHFSSYVREVAPGEIEIAFNIEGGKRKQGTIVFTLPDWAKPVDDRWLMCSVRRPGGVDMGTVDINFSADKQTAELCCGIGWDAVPDDKSSSYWVFGDLFYHI